MMITFGPGWQITDPFFCFCEISIGPDTLNLKKKLNTIYYFDPVIQTACQKEAYPESFINLG